MPIGASKTRARRLLIAKTAPIVTGSAEFQQAGVLGHEGKLRLRVNQDKSAVAPVAERMFLGHRLGHKGSLGIAPKSLVRMKDRLRQITRLSRGIALATMIAQVNAFTTG